VFQGVLPVSGDAEPVRLGVFRQFRELERRPRKVAAVALANKMARTVWAMMANGTAYRRTPQAA